MAIAWLDSSKKRRHAWIGVLALPVATILVSALAVGVLPPNDKYHAPIAYTSFALFGGQFLLGVIFAWALPYRWYYCLVAMVFLLIYQAWQIFVWFMVIGVILFARTGLDGMQ